jgi:hypothetical protein
MNEGRLTKEPAAMTVPEQVAILHAWFCQKVERAEPLRFHQDAWYFLLSSEEYRLGPGDYNARALAEDVALIVKYLRLMIRDGKRNLGALKARNFLEPSQFFADLEEARAALRKRKRAATVDVAHVRALPGGETIAVLDAKPDPEPSTAGPEIARQLAEFRRTMKEGS